jgi:hypothetical protein
MKRNRGTRKNGTRGVDCTSGIGTRSQFTKPRAEQTFAPRLPTNRRTVRYVTCITSFRAGGRYGAPSVLKT